MKTLLIIMAMSLSSVSALAEGEKIVCPERADDPEASRELASIWFSKGIDLAAEEQYAQAEQAFLCSYGLVAHPATLINAAKAAKHGGANERAVEIYQEVLETYPDDEKADTVRAEIAQLTGRGGADENGAADSADGASAEPASADNGNRDRYDRDGPVASDWRLLYDVARYEAAAKRYGNAVELFENYLERGADGITETRRQEVEQAIARLRGEAIRQKNQEIDATGVSTGPAEVPSTPPESPPPAEKTRPLQVAGWASVGVGSATLVAAVVTGAVALSYRNDLKNRCDSRVCTDPNDLERRDSMYKLADATDALIGVGGTIAAAGAIMLVVDKIRKERRGGSDKAARRISPMGSGIGITGAF